MTPEDINIDLFLKFITQREELRVRKEHDEPAPWTDDPVLSFYRFCNIRRQDDRVSRWLLKEYYPKLPLDADFWFAAAVARHLNWPPVLKELLADGVIPARAEEFWPGAFAARLEQLKGKLGKVYTSAYVVYPGHDKGKTKSHNMAHLILKPLAESAKLMRSTVPLNRIETLVTNLTTSYGISNFMAGQIAADLTYIPGQLDEATDLYTYAPRGPGSQQGLNRLLLRPLSFQDSAEDFSANLRKVLETIKEWTPYQDLTLHDVQNCFCEFDKYCRVLLDEGRPRQNYTPTTEF